MVADQLRATYDQTDGRDGFVSLEVSPILAHDTMGTIEEARQLWSLVNRANVMIKVPATREGLPAIQQLTAEGINVNITLLFGLPRYRQVVDAYLTGLERLVSTGKNLKNVASVASFFLSRIDTLVDTLLEKKITTSGRDATVAGRLQGQVATASAKVAYQIYKEIFGSDRFRKLQDNGARTQKLLWASTSTKNPAYSDTKYIEPLIGPDTINTLPIETLNAYREHGLPRLTLDENRDQAYRILQELPQAGINLDQITQDLEQQGVEKFRLALDRLMASLQEKQAATASSL
jgi:transaldolase